jgi:RNA polymerase sigma factor (sigma-70 family)
MKQTQTTGKQRPTADEPSMTHWVERARNGDQVAFHHLVDLFQAGVYRMIYYRTGSQVDAEDLTQDVLLKAFKHIRRLKSPAVFRSWLYRIAVNRVRDYYRRKHFLAMFQFSSMDDETFQETPEMAVDSQAPQNLAREEFWRHMERAMKLLSRMEKEVFLLRFLDHLSIKEITEALGKNESTVKTHLYRALGKLKTHMAGVEGLLEEMG